MGRGKIAARAGSVFVLALSGLIGLYQEQLTLVLWVTLVGSGLVFLWAWGVPARLWAAGVAFVHPALIGTRGLPLNISPQKSVLAHNYMRLLDMKDDVSNVPDEDLKRHEQAIYDLRGGLINSGLFSPATQQDLGRESPLTPVDKRKAVDGLAVGLMRVIRQKWQKYS